MISLNVYLRCNHVVSYNGYHNFMSFSVVMEEVFNSCSISSHALLLSCIWLFRIVQLPISSCFSQHNDTQCVIVVFHSNFMIYNPFWCSFFFSFFLLFRCFVVLLFCCLVCPFSLLFLLAFFLIGFFLVLTLSTALRNIISLRMVLERDISIGKHQWVCWLTEVFEHRMLQQIGW